MKKNEPSHTDKVSKTFRNRVRQQVKRFEGLARGLFSRECSLCGYVGLFTPFGNPPRIDAHCPSCSSLERHRLYALMIRRLKTFRPSDVVLHFAAEPQLTKHIRPLVQRYATAEIRESVKPDIILNIENISEADSSYDSVICNHVLEHVDDAKALSELYRIIKPGGHAFLTTPVIEGWRQTYENPTIIDDHSRTLHFGQKDHVRLYGRDLRDRIAKVGFRVSEFTAEEPDVHRFGLLRGETIFIAEKH